MRQPPKFIDTVTTAVLFGAPMLQLVISFRYGGALKAGDSTEVGAPQAMAEVTRWLTAPSRPVVVVTGLLLVKGPITLAATAACDTTDAALEERSVR
jgi:hypothetical protein